MKVQEGIYQHYKGNKYAVIGMAKHSETLEDLVVYKALYFGEHPFGTLWVRPANMFLEDVYVDGKAVPRFKYILPHWNNDLDIKELVVKGDE